MGSNSSRSTLWSTQSLAIANCACFITSSKQSTRNSPKHSILTPNLDLSRRLQLVSTAKFFQPSQFLIFFFFFLTVSLENVLGDIQELHKGMELTKKEYELRKDLKDEKQNTILKDFLTNAEEKLRRLRADSKAAQDAFSECVEYFGERQTDANAFFGLFARFIKTYKVFKKNILFVDKDVDISSFLFRASF